MSDHKVYLGSYDSPRIVRIIKNVQPSSKMIWENGVPIFLFPSIDDPTVLQPYTAHEALDVALQHMVYDDSYSTDDSLEEERNNEYMSALNHPIIDTEDHYYFEIMKSLSTVRRTVLFNAYFSDYCNPSLFPEVNRNLVPWYKLPSVTKLLSDFREADALYREDPESVDYFGYSLTKEFAAMELPD